jgi:hypothetical protein
MSAAIDGRTPLILMHAGQGLAPTLTDTMAEWCIPSPGPNAES